MMQPIVRNSFADIDAIHALNSLLQFVNEPLPCANENWRFQHSRRCNYCRFDVFLLRQSKRLHGCSCLGFSFCCTTLCLGNRIGGSGLRLGICSLLQFACLALFPFAPLALLLLSTQPLQLLSFCFDLLSFLQQSL